MSEWQPATDAEVAMRDALRTDDQESYFRILAGVDLLLPVSAEALAGNAPLGWGTWSTGGRTHVLAFTSTEALQACLADYSGSARRVPYSELANTWPNLEWWLAVNPGLPIEGYLPAWFVAQLSRGDLRLPTRGPGREKSQANRLHDLQAAAAAANAAHSGPDATTGAPQGPPPLGYPQQPPAAAAYPSPPGGVPAAYPQSGIPAAYPQSGIPAAYPQSGIPAAYGQSGAYPVQPGAAPGPYGAQPGSPYGPPPGYPQPPTGYPAPGSAAAAAPPQPNSAPPAGYPHQGSPAAAAYPQPSSAPPGGYPHPATAGAAGSAGYPQPSSAPPAGYPQPGSGAAAGYARPSSAPPAGYPQPGSDAAAGYPRPSSAPPHGYPQPSSAPPYGYPQPSSAPPAGYPRPGSAPPAAYPQSGNAVAYPHPTSAPPAGPGMDGSGPGYPRPSSAPPASPLSPLGGAPAGYAKAAAAAGQPPGFPAADEEEQPPAAKPEQLGPGGLPLRTPGAVLPSGLPSRTPTPAPDAFPQAAAPAVPTAPAVPAVPTAPAVPTGYSPPSVPPESTTGGWPVVRPGPDQRGPQPPHGLPVRTPMANTPPVPEHLRQPEPDEPPLDPRWAGIRGAQEAPVGFPQGPASPQAAAQAAPDQLRQPPAGATDEPARGYGGPLPRRQATPATESAPMTSFPAFKSPAERAATSGAEQGRPGTMPPVIPGSPGTDRPARVMSTPPLEIRGATVAHPPLAPQPVDFQPANDVERDLFEAAEAGSTDQFLSTLLLATVLVPVAQHSRPGSAPGESGFEFRTEQLDGETFLVVFTSRDRLGEHFAEPTRTVSVRFYELIRNWPDPEWSFAVNPGSPVGAKYPGPQVIALASWATEAGLGAEPVEHPAVDPHAPVPAPEPASDDAQHATVMQKTLPPDQVDFYLERGYDRVAGFVHRATEVEHLRTPGELFGALGLTYEGSQHMPDAKEAYVLRWPAYRPSLYRIPYGGQNEQALRAMDGWVIERPPFRGNGFAPGEGRDVIAEFKVDSVRLPHGAQLWRIDADGIEHMVAIFDNDGPQWRRVGEQ